MAGTLNWTWIPAVLLIFSATYSTSPEFPCISPEFPCSTLRELIKFFEGFYLFTNLLGIMSDAVNILCNVIFNNLNILSLFDKRGNESK